MLTVGQIREAIKGLPNDRKVIVKIDGWEHVTVAGELLDGNEAVEVKPDHVKATLTIYA